MVRDKRMIGADELMAELHANPEWLAQKADRESKRAADESQFTIEEQPIISDLELVGIEVKSVWDLVNTNDRYESALPVLLKHLAKPYHLRIREGIIRALTTPDARGLAAGAILAELRKETDTEIRWTLANALTVVAERKDAGAIMTLMNDIAYQDVRERLSDAI